MKFLLLAIASLILACGGSDHPHHDTPAGTDAHHEHGHEHEHGHSEPENHVVLPDAALAENGIEVAEAGPRTLASTNELPGEITLDRDRTAHVVPRLSGVVAEIHAHQGDVVRRGQRLAAIDSRELADAKSEFIEAVHVLELAQATFVREERLWKRRITPEIDYLVARHKLEESEIHRQIAEQKLRALGVPANVLQALSVEPGGRVEGGRVRLPFGDLLTRYVLTAPLGGTIIEKHLALGEAIAADADVFVIADLSRVWVDIAVPPKDLAQVRVGQRASVRAPALAMEATSHVSFVGALVGEETRSAQARVVLANPDGRWRPGLFVTVVLAEVEAAVDIAVPNSAVQEIENHPVVFVREGDEFQVRPIETGRRGEGWVEIVEGLTAGERYAAKGAFLLKADVGKSGAAHDH